VTAPSSFPEATQATSALIWSIVGLVCCGPAAIVGFVQARGELEAIGAGRRDPSNAGTANAARIVAIVAGVLWLVGIGALVLAVMAGIGLSAGSGLDFSW
jgi:hypothetical protein